MRTAKVDQELEWLKQNREKLLRRCKSGDEVSQRRLREIQEMEEERRYVYSNKNQFHNTFIDAWLRNPDDVLLLLKAVRRYRETKEFDITKKAMSEYPNQLPPKGSKDDTDEDRKKWNNSNQQVKRARRLTKPSQKVRRATGQG